MPLPEHHLPSRQIPFLRSVIGLVLEKVVRMVSRGSWDESLNVDIDPPGPYLLRFEDQNFLFVDGYPDDRGDNLLVYREVQKYNDLSYQDEIDSQLSSAWEGCVGKELVKLSILTSHSVEAGLALTFSNEVLVYLYDKSDELCSSREFPFEEDHSSVFPI